jgi:hypothetical protein
MQERMDNRTILASELVTYEYCHRAWAYQRQGETNSEAERMAGGTRFHRSLNYRFLFSRLLLRLGQLTVVAALMWAGATLVWRWFGG